MNRTFAEYSQLYQHVVMRRDGGIIELRLHTDGGPLVWGAGPHQELGHCFTDVGADRDNRVVILTGSGDAFLRALDNSWVGQMTPEKWDRIHTDGIRLLTALLAIPVPVIGAVNGPATVHAELAVLSDITLAADTAYFQDAPHFRYGTVPGDGVHVVWPALLGPNRARYFLLTAQKIDAGEALRLGVVNEVLSKAALMDRAWEHARALASQHDITLRCTRAALVTDLRRKLADGLGHGLALEGLTAYATWPQG